ncbi:hypothetical protein AB434_0638 [Heyndrickxia coagulans]|uniref:Uncharacterized protein n=1 Tax=Heyndrickxia coagulans TaxID=1398 RepID=A0A0C5CIW4_HEYCO|nr:hypothetical protein SB48_HM08orf00820 [Heyndrickxia coagulans]AKN53043.1 hypothetical protein AB434_0638 [Heyndrickxia coagulans]KWZ82757.1 hypothetical protein HMPREF3213_01602 [Heyndrickxia coagulans]KYC62395.1 hypothetical protein B4100_1866 [Heyndrickxia coagulans]
MIPAISMNDKKIKYYLTGRNSGIKMNLTFQTGKQHLSGY